MVIVVCGPRVWSASGLVSSSLSALGSVSRLFVGDARGVDALACSWARLRGIPVSRFVAKWSRFGRSAGARRSAAMLVAAGSGALVVAFCPAGSVLSVGTALSVRLARSRGLAVRFVSPVAPFRLVG